MHFGADSWQRCTVHPAASSQENIRGGRMVHRGVLRIGAVRTQGWTAGTQAVCVLNIHTRGIYCQTFILVQHTASSSRSSIQPLRVLQAAESGAGRRTCAFLPYQNTVVSCTEDKMPSVHYSIKLTFNLQIFCLSCPPPPHQHAN